MFDIKIVLGLIQLWPSKILFISSAESGEKEQSLSLLKVQALTKMSYRLDFTEKPIFVQNLPKWRVPWEK